MAHLGEHGYSEESLTIHAITMYTEPKMINIFLCFLFICRFLLRKFFFCAMSKQPFTTTRTTRPSRRQTRWRRLRMQ